MADCAGSRHQSHHSSGDTALHLSTWNLDSRNVLKSLLQRGVDVMPAHNDGWNIFSWAAQEDDLFVAKTVLRLGVGVDSRDKRSRTPLMYAAANGNRRVLDLLLSRGADVMRGTRWGGQP